MTFFEGFYSWATNDVSVNARLGTNIYPIKLPQVTQEHPLPDVCCVVRLVSGKSDHTTHDGGASDWHRVRVELSVYGKSVRDCEQIILLLRSKLRGFNGHLGGGTSVRLVVDGIAGPRSVEDTVTRYIGIQIDILGMVDESTVS